MSDMPPELVQRLEGVGKSFGERLDVFEQEVLKSWYPNITEQEIAVCRAAFGALEDHAFPACLEVFLHLMNSPEKFSSEDETKNAIDAAHKKGFITYKLQLQQFGGYCRIHNRICEPIFKPFKFLYLDPKIEGELRSGRSQILEGTFDAFFPEPRSTI
jgi:hypothetical protein